MTLSTGTKLSHYEITSQIGKGGMGEVYQAKDQKLGRDVAIKVLPEEFARDADRVARFQREAKLLASLNHPNIAAIYGLEESDRTHFLVMELIEGQTLADRIKSGAIPVEEALKLALQIAEALEAAHEKGVIHRDLKPANIKVTPEGKVKVLDFGLAKAFAGEQSDINLSNSPTLSQAATMQGVILGTAAYMSPEQAKGKTVDKRTDIWAFGAVLFEMLTGKAAFHGDEVSEILASVIKGDTTLDLLPSNIHQRIHEVISRCLQKDLRKRYPDIANARYEIEQALADPRGVFVTPPAQFETRVKIYQMLPWIAAAVLLTAIIAGLAGWEMRPPEPRTTTRFYYELPPDQQFNMNIYPLLAVSPDGGQFLYATNKGLFLRSLDKLDAVLLPGTEDNPWQPFFSPDGKWVGYWSMDDSQLKKLPLSGGIPSRISDDRANGSFNWLEDDAIYFGQPADGIVKISPDDGTSETVIGGEGEMLYHPRILPDGKSMIFTVRTDEGYKIAVQSLESQERTILFPGDDAHYLPTGHLIYASENYLYAVPFDPGRRVPTGGPVAVIEDLFRMRNGAPQFAVSDSGTLVYLSRTGLEESAKRKIVWVDLDGNESPIPAPPDDYYLPKISPDGRYLAFTILPNIGKAAGEGDIWIWNLVRNDRVKLTNNKNLDVAPLWTPDGKRIAFGSQREQDLSVYWKAVDDTGDAEFVKSVPGKVCYPAAWSKDGQTLLLGEFNMSVPMSFDIGMLEMDGSGNYESLLNETYHEAQPRISPNGEWIAYTSSDSGQNQVYVRPFPGIKSGGRKPVSTNGGDSPLWSPHGETLYYRNGDMVMAVSVKTDPDMNLGQPKPLFQKSYISSAFMFGNFDFSTWDIHPDGKKFLMLKPDTSTTEESYTSGQRKITVVTNWFEELKKRVPVK
ncbi:MAG: serine/threonine-protein kinase [Acidobacteria bacterium]|nr:serine/threonine-protein kinase [Acidobacteriota bacterium]